MVILRDSLIAISSNSLMLHEWNSCRQSFVSTVVKLYSVFEAYSWFMKRATLPLRVASIFIRSVLVKDGSTSLTTCIAFDLPFSRAQTLACFPSALSRYRLPGLSQEGRVPAVHAQVRQHYYRIASDAELLRLS